MCYEKGVDWGSVKQKYEEILALFLSNQEDDQDMPHILFTKQEIATKVKSLRQSYRKAVDSGRQSGGGRVVMTFYDLCKDIWGGWGGSPAATAIGEGLETSEINELLENVENEIHGDLNISGDENDHDNEDSNHNSVKETGTSRINKMTEFLKSRRNMTIQKKVPIDHQLLAISQEELAFKKEMMANMKEQEMDFNKTMKEMQATLANFTNTMAGTFGSMRMLTPHNISFQPQPPPHIPSYPSYHQGNTYLGGASNRHHPYDPILVLVLAY